MTRDPADKTYIVPPVERAFKLLRHIASGGDCANVSGAAKLLGINRTTLMRLLHTLEAEGMIEEAPYGAGWRLGVGMIGLAADALGSRDLVQIARPVMNRLASTLVLSSHLGILDGREVIYLLRESPNTHLVSNYNAGARLPAHGTSIGRILLAHLAEDDLRELYDGAALAAFSQKTPTTYASLTRQLEEDRRRGFSWSEGNFEAGIGSCAVAIHDHTGSVTAGLNVTGPEVRFSGDAKARAEIVEAMKAAADEISSSLGHRLT